MLVAKMGPLKRKRLIAAAIRVVVMYRIHLPIAIVLYHT